LIESDTLQIVPSFRKHEILNMAKEGFHDVSFSRPSKKLPWGIPVPGDDSQNMYVWCDALTNYISVLDYKNNSELFQSFWENGETVHVIGKDILRFHAGIWIGMLLSAGEKIPDKIFVHGFLTSEGHKMSKSLGNVVNPFGEVKKYGSDALRYFLLREVPVGQDSDFSKKRFEEIYQAHLANGLGNLVSRVLHLCQKAKMTYSLPPEGYTLDILESYTKKIEVKMDQFLLHEAISVIFEVIDYCDKRINEEKPWELINTDPKKNKILLTEMIQCLFWIQSFLSPFLPTTGKKIYDSLNDLEHRSDFPIPMLFPRLEKLNLPEESAQITALQAPPLPKITFQISPKAKQIGIYAKPLFLENVSVKKTPKGLQKFCKKQAEQWIQNGGRENSEWRNRVDAMNSVKTKLGYSAEKNIHSAEGLAQLLIKNGKLPMVSNIVDLYNIISLKHGLSAGAHDCSALSSTVRIDLCTGSESFTPMTGKEHMSLSNYPLLPNEYAFFLNDNEIGCRSDSAQCESSKILVGNRNILIYFQALVGKEKWVENACTEFTELLHEYKLIS